jgi:hypothetical protein
MSSKQGRRSFFRNIGISGMTAAIAPVTFAENRAVKEERFPGTETEPGSNKRTYNSCYNEEFLNRVAFQWVESVQA